MIVIWKPIGVNPKLILKIWEGGNPGYETYEGAVAIEEALLRLHGKPGLICWAMKDRAFQKRHLARCRACSPTSMGRISSPKLRTFFKRT